MSSKMISPLPAERKLSNFWLYMDFKPLCLALIGFFIVGLFVLSFGFLKQANALPGWLSPLTDAFNGYAVDKIWAVENVDRFGSSYSRAERELLKFMFGISFAVAVLYNFYALAFVLRQLPRLRRAFSGVNAEVRKVIISLILGEALLAFSIFDGQLFLSPGGRFGSFASNPLPAFFYLVFCYLTMLFASWARRIVAVQVHLTFHNDEF
ncbi:hypothetical protein [Ferrovibrio sp.]|uniref:hypothetical protein n=1 Tax=Ferrovibrio sp. TaxID=1917215 RepID=UPI003D12035A